MVSHDYNAADTDELTLEERRQRALGRLDDGHAALLDALAGLDEAEAFLGSRWSVWEVMQHLLTENFVQALEEIASGQRAGLPPFDARADRIAADVARLEANYRRLRTLLAGLSAEQMLLPATPYNPENNYPALSLLDLIERTSGHEGNHARQVSETRRFVAAFRSAERVIMVAGLGPGDPALVPQQARELLANADYVAGSPAALDVARRWIRSVELPLRRDNRAELVNRLARDARAGLWSLVVALGDPAESAPGLLANLASEAGAQSVAALPAPGYFRLALAQLGISPLRAMCASVEQFAADDNTDASDFRFGEDSRALVILGAEEAELWRDYAAGLSARLPGDAPVRLVTGLATARPSVSTLTVSELVAGDFPAGVDSAVAVG